MLYDLPVFVSEPFLPGFQRVAIAVSTGFASGRDSHCFLNDFRGFC